MYIYHNKTYIQVHLQQSEKIFRISTLRGHSDYMMKGLVTNDKDGGVIRYIYIHM